MEKVSELLGGRKVLGRKLGSQLELVPLVRKGLPYGAFESLTEKLALSVEVVSESLHLPRRTLARRKESNRLDAHESERLVRLAEVASQANEILGTLEKARQWLVSSNRALGGASPLSLLDTDVGTKAALDVLLRIEHGVYS
jgi:putative toxin-antitoxin system antitoxin component (TIGR02293 family)